MLNCLIKPKVFNPGDRKEISSELLVDSINFKIYKFNNREKPNKDRVLIITCFSEFGCETVSVLYCIPRLLQIYSGYYVICVGWNGREFFYRHLVDEYWELDEKHQWLREYSRAFHHVSRNLKKLEERILPDYGKVIPCLAMGHICLTNFCNNCKHYWNGLKVKSCPKCSSENVKLSLFNDVENSKKTAIHLPYPSLKKLKEAQKLVKNGSVGIFARNRKTYGRNLQQDFYIKLIDLLKSFGYNIVWLGEKQSTMACPIEGIPDFREVNDLELTLAIITRLSFTIQFWTASSRLSGMMKIPYLLFESPDQIFGKGQEGYRLELTTLGKKKIVFTNFLEIYNDNEKGLELTTRAINEMKDGNFNDIFLREYNGHRGFFKTDS